ncbi:hypothetical protein [Nonomuraea bangladeshensis]|uniref:hypothetical protein n=1 Tax=Nonomuraea bangladeshensis TaxID=404385 RepID=UPI0031E2DAE5
MRPRRARPRHAALRKKHDTMADASTTPSEAHLLAQDVERRCRRRWSLMWEPYRQVFTAYPVFDYDVHTPVEAKTAPELWRVITEDDPELLRVTVEALPAHPPTNLHLSPSFLLQEVSW